MDWKSSETFGNLKTALDGELIAGGRYQVYSKQAVNDGFIQISDIFNETAKNELEHAELWIKFLNGGRVPPTLENLMDCIRRENYEWTIMYREFAEKAREEGYEDIAITFDQVAGIEKMHENRYKILMNNIENDQVFCKEKDELWICTNCGYEVYGRCAPKRCPVCGYPQGYFEIKATNY